MNTHDHDFDAKLRRLHAQAVAQVSTRTKFQLRRRAAAPPLQSRQSPMRAFAWPLAAACAVGMLAIGLQWRHSDPAATTPLPVATVADDDIGGAYTALDETPDLYLWLASTDASLAME